MLRDPESYENVTITGVLKNGWVFSRRDVTSATFGDAGEFVSFWDKEDIKIIPVQNVYDITLHYNK